MRAFIMVVLASLLVACGGAGGGGGGSSPVDYTRFRVVNSPLSTLNIVSIEVDYQLLDAFTGEFDRFEYSLPVTLLPGQFAQVSAPSSSFFVSVLVVWSDGVRRTLYGSFISDTGYDDGSGTYVLETKRP